MSGTSDINMRVYYTSKHTDLQHEVTVNDG